MPSLCRNSLWVVVAILLLASSGCRTAPTLSDAQVAPGPGDLYSFDTPAQVHDTMPRELSKVILPTYTIEPPDVLLVEAIHVVPRSPYHLRTLDLLGIEVRGTLPDAPIAGAFPVEMGGRINLGTPYGTLQVAGMTVDEAKAAIEKHLAEFLKEPFVSVTLAETAAKQQIIGEHMVGPDGTLTLGSYGSVSVVGNTIAEAKLAIEKHLSKYLDSPEISVDVAGYNSKVYYIVTQGAGMGDTITRYPVTGNETILDAISQVNGLDQVSSKRIWIARPTGEPGNVHMLPVHWDAITAQASTATNYQILPGDRVFVAEDKLVAFDTHLGKVMAPLERIMGFITLGTSTASELSGNVLRNRGTFR